LPIDLPITAALLAVEQAAGSDMTIRKRVDWQIQDLGVTFLVLESCFVPLVSRPPLELLAILTKGGRVSCERMVGVSALIQEVLPIPVEDEAMPAFADLDRPLRRRVDKVVDERGRRPEEVREVHATLLQLDKNEPPIRA